MHRLEILIGPIALRATWKTKIVNAQNACNDAIAHRRAF
jgi:hypothetical protein